MIPLPAPVAPPSHSVASRKGYYIYPCDMRQVEVPGCDKRCDNRATSCDKG